jgi:hypothetical protein
MNVPFKLHSTHLLSWMVRLPQRTHWIEAAVNDVAQ